MRLILIFFVLPFISTKGNNPYAAMPKEDFFKQSFLLQKIDLSNLDYELIEAGVFHLSNKYRQEKGRYSLEYQENLSYAAYLHSKEMSEKHFFNHNNRYTKNLATLADRASFVNYKGYETLAENIFYGYVELRNPGNYYDLCNFIVQSFISSKGHRENLLAKDINEIGCGIHFLNKIKDGYVYFNFTQDFGWR